jgi:mono/diheme cytochrome c family protein
MPPLPEPETMIRPMLRRGALAALLTLAPFFSYHAAADDDELPPPDKTAGVNLRDPAVIAAGVAIVSTTCGGYCHGSEGRGGKAPSLRNRMDLTPEMLHTTITFGRKRAGHLMPAWGGALSDEKIWTAVAGIISLRHADGDAPADTQTPTH